MCCPIFRSLLVVAGLLALAYSGASGCHLPPAHWVEDIQQLELSSNDIETFRAVTHNGAISIIASEDDDAPIVATVTIRVGDESEESAWRRLESLELLTPVSETTQELSWQWRSEDEAARSVQVAYEITLPKRLAVEAQTSNGAISVTGVEGPCDLQSKNGRIDVDGAQGRLRAETKNGAIVARSDATDVDLQSYNGKIDARLASPTIVEGTLKTYNGAIRLSLDQRVAVELDCKTRNGRIRAALPLEVDEPEKTSKRPRTLAGKLNEGGPRLSLETYNGSITLDAELDR